MAGTGVRRLFVPAGNQHAFQFLGFLECYLTLLKSGQHRGVAPAQVASALRGAVVAVELFRKRTRLVGMLLDSAKIAIAQLDQSTCDLTETGIVLFQNRSEEHTSELQSLRHLV